MSAEISNHKIIDEHSLKNEERDDAFAARSGEAVWRIELEKPLSVGLPADEQIDHFYRFAICAECRRAVANTSGFEPADEIVGARLSEFFPREDKKNIEYLRAFINSNYRLENAESRKTDPEGNPKIFLNDLTGVIENGFVVRVWRTRRDITARREIERAKAHLAAIVESSDDAIVSKDLSGIITSWNKGAEKIFGYTAAEAVGRSITMLIPPRLIHEESELINRVKKGEAVKHYETVRRRKDGTEIDISLTVSPIKNESGEIIGASKIARHITESKRTAESFRESQAILALSMQSSLMGAWSRDLATENVWCSPELEEIFGLKQGSFSGSEEEFFDLIHEDDREKIRASIQRAIARQREYAVEFRFWHTDGSLRWMEGRGKPAYSEKGAPVRIYGIGIDITERKLAEEKLRESAQRLRAIYNGTQEYIGLLTPDGTLLETNRASLEFGGAKHEEEVGRPFWETIWFKYTPDAPELIRKSISRASKGELVRFEAPICDPSGETMIFEISFYPVCNEKGEVVLIVPEGRDITEHKKAQEKLRESEEKFAKAFNSSPLVLTITSLETGKLIEVNETFVRTTGFSRGEAIGRTTESLGLWTNSADRETELSAVQKEGEIRDLEFRFKVKNGQELIGLLSAERLEIGGAPCALTVIQDITERKKAEEISERYRLLSMRARDVILFFHPDGQIVDANQIAAETYGFPQADLLKMRIHDLRAPETLDVVEEQLSKANSGGIQFETVHRRKDGTRFPVEVTSVGSDIGGERLLISIIRDITERRKNEEALLKAERRASEEYLELLARIVPVAQTLGTARDLFSIYRAVHEFVCASMPCTAFFVSFYDAERSLRTAAYAWGEDGEVDISTLPPMTLTANGGPNSQAIFQKKSVVVNGFWDLVKNRPHVLLQENGQDPNSSLVVPMNVMTRVIGTLEVQAYEDRVFTNEHIIMLEMVANLAAVAIENVRLLQVEADARETAETANRAKDEFLSVLSHELRTPLNSMLGWVKMLRAGVLDKERSAKAIEVIERNTLLQNNLIEDLLDVSRIISGKMRIEKQAVDLVKVFTDTIEILRPVAAQKDIRFEFKTSEILLMINGDAARLQQILTNLVQNSVKFTNEGGTISVSLARNADFARLTVKDNGIGIAKEILPFIFERFQQADSSTKRVYSCLGLGLTIVRNLVGLHSGTIEAESAGEGKGATFTVEIPLTKEFVEKTSSDVRSAIVPADNFVLSGARILLVDDDIESLMPLQIFLEREKAEIILATSAKEALENLARENFHVLITDIGMPLTDGYDLIAKVRQLQTEQNAFIAAIALTAYASPDDRRRALAAGFQKHFAKPVDYDELLSVIKVIYEESGK